MTELNHIDPARTAALSGHRPSRLPGRGEPDAPETLALAVALRGQIEKTVQSGMDTYINGLMAGFDVLAAEQVIVLKAQYPHIRLVTVAPYSVDFFTREKCWTDDWVKRAKEICRQSDIGVSIAEHYRAGIYYERNRTLVDHSSELICYWDGGGGGTQFTVQYAVGKELRIKNLFTDFPR